MVDIVNCFVYYLFLQDIDDESGSRDAVEPILSFPSSCFQYVTSVEWSPVHPGVFSAIASGLWLQIICGFVTDISCHLCAVV